MNRYKGITIALILINFVLAMTYFQQEEQVSVGEFEMPKASLDAFKDLANGHDFVLCSIKEGKCVNFKHIN